jgi:hypothetical protein
MAKSVQAENRADSANSSTNDTRHVVEDALTERQNLDVVELETPDLFRRSIDFARCAGTLHEDQLAAVAKQGSGEGDELSEGTHGARGELVEWLVEPNILSPYTHDLDVVESEHLDLFPQPRDAALHRFDENQGHIRSRDREDDTGQPRAAPDVADATGTKQGSDDRAVQNVPGPDARQLEGADESALLPLSSQVRGEPASEFDAIAEQGGRDDGLRLDTIL